MDVEPLDSIPDLDHLPKRKWTSLLLKSQEFHDDFGHRCLRPPVAECHAVRVSANKADSGSTMQSKVEQCPSPSHSPILALPDLVLGVNSPLVSVHLGDSDQAGLTVPAPEQDLASPTRALEVVGMAHSGPRAVMDDLPVEVQETIASARAPATRKLYSSKWGVFESWCLTRAIDPVNCPVGPVLEFLQERMTAGAAATTLRVYVAAIAARRALGEVLSLAQVTLRPRPGYFPKVLSTSFRSQVVKLPSFHPPPFASSEDERLHMLCPVQALKLYVDHSKVWRKTSQLLVCFGVGRRGLATSKQRISHWVRDAILLAYEVQNLPSPLSLRAHSTRGIAPSQALFRGVPLEDICVAAGWSSPHTFVKFYNLDVDTAPGSQILSV